MFLDPKFKNKDFLFIQTATTINFRTSFLGRLLCSGVDYQIEHHLFPGISHHHYPQMSKLVKRILQKTRLSPIAYSAGGKRSGRAGCHFIISSLCLMTLTC